MENQNIKDKKINPGTFKDKLTRTQQEIENLAVQFALGKAEAKDKFEEIKKDFHSKIQQWEKTGVGTKINEKGLELKKKFEELTLQLSLGKAEAKEIFDEQRKKITHSLKEFEKEIRNNPELKESYTELQFEIEKFKLKLELMKLNFGKKKFELSAAFEKNMKEVKENISELFDSAGKKPGTSGHRFQNFEKETQLAYKHLKNAFKSLSKK